MGSASSLGRPTGDFTLQSFFSMPSLPGVRPVLSLIPLLLIAACVGEEAVEDAPPETEILYFEPIGYGDRASIRDTMEIAIRDEQTWRAYADSLRPVAPFRTVDFSQAIVLLAALPQQASGYIVEFVSVEESDSIAFAEYVVEIPDTDCLTGLANVVPFQAVLVRKTEKPFRFKRRIEEYRCTFGRRK